MAGGDASLLNCEFTRCQVRAYVSEEECLLLTMKTVEMYYQWAGAVGATTESTRQSARFARDLAVLTWIREMGNAN